MTTLYLYRCARPRLLARLVPLAALCLFVAPAGAQRDTVPAGAPVPASPTDSLRPADEEIAARRRPRDRVERRRRERWTAELRTGTIYDSNPWRDNLEQGDAAGGLLGAEAEYESANRRLWIRGSSTAFQYSGFDRWDRWTQLGDAEYRVPVGTGTTLTLDASAALRTLTVEYRVADQVAFGPRLEVDVTPADRVGVFVSTRQRRYRDEDDTWAWSPYAGVSYRHRWGSWRYADVGYRYDHNDATVDRRDFDRHTLSGSWTWAVSSTTRFRPGVAARWERYAQQTDPRSGQIRSDVRWHPYVTWIQELGGPWRIDAEYEFQQRGSTVAVHEYSAHRLEAILRYSWRP